jgi:hypothetical protein
MREALLDAGGRRRAPATMPGFHAGRPPRNKGIPCPADPPTVEEIVAVTRAAGDSAHGRRLRGLICPGACPQTATTANSLTPLNYNSHKPTIAAAHTQLVAREAAT